MLSMEWDLDGLVCVDDLKYNNDDIELFMAIFNNKLSNNEKFTRLKFCGQPLVFTTSEEIYNAIGIYALKYEDYHVCIYGNSYSLYYYRDSRFCGYPCDFEVELEEGVGPRNFMRLIDFIKHIPRNNKLLFMFNELFDFNSYIDCNKFRTQLYMGDLITLIKYTVFANIHYKDTLKLQMSKKILIERDILYLFNILTNYGELEIHVMDDNGVCMMITNKELLDLFLDLSNFDNQKLLDRMYHSRNLFYDNDIISIVDENINNFIRGVY